MLRKITLLTTLWLLTISCLFAQFKLTDSIPADPKVKIGKLSNGLTYYIRQNKKPEQKVELRLAINAGSIMEDDDQQGLAHMAEHMAFNGTKNFKKNDIVSYLQSIGVGFGNDLNAYTSFDETVYILPIPTDKPGNLEKGFQILEDWAHQVTYLTEDIEGERNVILEESRLGKGADDRMFRKIYPKLFAGSKYANRLPIGVDSIIKTFPPDAILRFYRDWYRPNLMAVLVVGDIEPAKAESLIKKHFDGLKNPENPRPRNLADVPPYKGREGIVVTDKEATNYSVDIYYSAFADKQATTVGEYKEDIVKNIYSTLINQRLRELTQKENPPFLYGFVSFGSYARGYNQVTATAGVGNGDPKKALDVLVEEIERAKRFGFTAAELDRAKKNVLANMERSYNERNKTESEQLVAEYIRNFLTNEPMPGIEKEYEYTKQLVPTILLEEVNAVAKSLEKTPDFLVNLTGPDPEASRKLPEAAELVAAATAAAGRSDIKPYEEKAIAASLVEQKPKPGKVVSETKNAQLGSTTWTLSNGITVELKKTNFKDDQVLLGARRAGGIGIYGPQDKYNANYAAAVVGSMGVGNFSPTDLQKALTGKVASGRAVITNTTDGFSGSSSVKDVETMLQLVYLSATAPRLDTGLYKSFLQRNKAQTAFIMADPQTSFIDTLVKTMYANDPRAPIAVPRPEYFDNINLDRAMQIYKERVGDVTGMHFVIIGNIDMPKMKPLVEQYLGALPAAGKKTNFKDNGLRPAKGKVDLNVYKGKEEKSLILAMHSGEVPYSEDLDMKAEAISEILNIRIIEELREKIQGIYSGGMSGGLNKIPYPSYQFFIQLPCGPEKVDTLLLAMNTEIENLKKKGPSEADMKKVKEQWIEQNKEAMKENGTWLNKMLELKFPGADVNRFLKYPEYVNKLTVKGVQDAANVLLNNKNVVTAVLRPEAKTDTKASNAPAKPAAAATIGGRKTDVQKLVELPAAEFAVEVFDNGDIDGDIITLYWNGEAVVSKQTLSDKPITVSLKIDPNRPKNELLMYAENLGTTPPNTAIAYAVCNGQRIEIRLSSDNDKNGTAQFKIKK